MKKIGVISMIIICVVAVCLLARPVEKQDKELAGTTMRVCYNEVNVRAEPNTDSEIVDQYTLGQTVVLSGKTVTRFLSGLNDTWYETSDGYWITGDALLENWVYKAKFGN